MDVRPIYVSTLPSYLPPRGRRKQEKKKEEKADSKKEGKRENSSADGSDGRVNIIA